MSDSSSVDRWHPSNVEWPADSEGSCPAPGSQPAVVRWSSGWNASRHEVIPADAYEALYADRGRVLAAARELAEAVAKELDETEHGWIFNYANPDSDAIGAALAAFREVDHG